MLSSVGLVISNRKLLISDKKGCIIYDNIPFAAFDKAKGTLLCVGTDADKLRGRNDVLVRRFMEHGTVSDVRCAAAVLMPILNKITGPSFFKPDVAVAVPSSLCDTARRAFIDCLKASGAHRTTLIPAPTAAAAGLGLEKGETNIIITLDGDISSFAVVQFVCEVVSTSAYIGYDDFDMALIRYMRKCKGAIISHEAAQTARRGGEEVLTIQGISVSEGQCVELCLEKDELSAVYSPVIKRFCELFCDFADSISPALITSAKNIYITGSEPCIPALADAISNATKISTQITDDRGCLARGAGLLSNKKLHRELGLTYLYEGTS